MPRPIMAMKVAALTLVSLCVLPAVPAMACEFFLPDQSGGPAAARFETVPDGIVSGMLRCGDESHAAFVWTLGVDADQPSLGIRDDKLIETGHTGPLSELLKARVEDHVRLTVLERTETVDMARSPMPEGWFRYTRFFTFCEEIEGGDPLDCSVGKARIKGRRMAEDTDGNGYLDVSTHEINFYDGASKLHVLGFTTPYSDSMTADAGLWIEALNAVSAVLEPRELALAD